MPSTGSCEFACRSDGECSAGERCCATGCGTACTPTQHHTVCQQRRYFIDFILSYLISLLDPSAGQRPRILSSIHLIDMCFAFYGCRVTIVVHGMRWVSNQLATMQDWREPCERCQKTSVVKGFSCLSMSCFYPLVTCLRMLGFKDVPVSSWCFRTKDFNALCANELCRYVSGNLLLFCSEFVSKHFMIFRALALHTAAESGNPPAWTWVPKCKEDGTFETVQCRGSDQTCWCVNAAGNEVSKPLSLTASETVNVKY